VLHPQGCHNYCLDRRSVDTDPLGILQMGQNYTFEISDLAAAPAGESGKGILDVVVVLTRVSDFR
jgi:hypothetical protein